jgi:hypothetical protein
VDSLKKQFETDRIVLNHYQFTSRVPYRSKLQVLYYHHQKEQNKVNDTTRVMIIIKKKRKKFIMKSAKWIPTCFFYCKVTNLPTPQYYTESVNNRTLILRTITGYILVTEYIPLLTIESITAKSKLHLGCSTCSTSFILQWENPPRILCIHAIILQQSKSVLLYWPNKYKWTNV